MTSQQDQEANDFMLAFVSIHLRVLEIHLLLILVIYGFYKRLLVSFIYLFISFLHFIISFLYFFIFLFPRIALFLLSEREIECEELNNTKYKTEISDSEGEPYFDEPLANDEWLDRYHRDVNNKPGTP